MPASSAVRTAALASARNGSMIPTIPTNIRPSVRDMGSPVMRDSSASSMNLAANASTRRPCRPIRSLAASMSARTSSMGT